VDLAAGNLRQQSESHGINAGNNNYVTIITELDNHAHISGGTADLGAYEFALTPAMLVRRLILTVEQTSLGNKNKQPLLVALLPRCVLSTAATWRRLSTSCRPSKTNFVSKSRHGIPLWRLNSPVPLRTSQMRVAKEHVGATLSRE
jgi:hypothetical protein